MNDERFEQDIRAAARRIASHPVPDGLRARVTSIPADHPRPAPRGTRLALRFGVGGLAAAMVIAAVVLVTLGPSFRAGPVAVPTRSPTGTSPGVSATPTGSVPSPSTQPVLPDVVRQLAMYDVETDLMAASDGRLFAVRSPTSGTGATLLRIDPDGSIIREVLSDPLAPYFSRLVADGSSLYLATSVNSKFTDAADELIRIDGATLKVIARTTLPGGVIGLVADANDVWLALADRVIRLDSATLDITASRVIPGTSTPPAGSASVNSLALGPGELLATVGGIGNATLYRLDPADLSILGQTDLPDPAQVTGVVADGESAWLTGLDWVEPLDRSGQPGSRIPTPGLQLAAPQGQGLLALVAEGGGPEALLQVDPAGAIIGRTVVGDAGAQMALDGQDVWLLHGLSVAHWTLIAPQP